MEYVQETPAKRRKTGEGYVATSEPYDSQNDSGDGLFEDYETVATVPILQPATPQQPGGSETFFTPSHITQPTQILHATGGQRPSVVQVAASSPFRQSSPSSPAPAKNRRPGGILASTMAPAGTSFRPPMGIRKPPVVDLSDDEGPTFRGGSSDDELQRSNRIDIKPSTFIQSAQRISGANAPKARMTDSSGAARFKEITSSSFYKPVDSHKSRGSALSGSVYDSRNRDENHTISTFSAPIRSADVMANAYGGSTRTFTQTRQTAPARALPEQDVSIDDVEDYQLRQKIVRMQKILPQYSVLVLKNALIAKRANFDDAIDFLMSQEDQPQEADLKPSISQVKPTSAEPTRPRKAPAKQQIKAPVQTIQERWTATQPVLRNPQSPKSPVAAPPKPPRRRLVQGRKHPSPTVEARVKPIPTRNRSPISLDSDSDSGIGQESETDVEIEGKVLKFLNTCSIEDLVDIAAISDQNAKLLLTQKPFRNLEEARQVRSRSSGTKKRSVGKPVGEKIVDKCIDMWVGYEAVDSLVKQCETLGKPVADEMKNWGLDVFGASKGGEMDLVSFGDLSNDKNSERSTRDSGIGTPTSTSLSADENSDVDMKKTSKLTKDKFSHQPKIMGDGVVLKDYQVVGMNWLALLFEKQLSCILADDMGLGKTCQVIAFLALLFEQGIKGPHLIIVPGSTLENWLREFSVFCPGLVVMPYYAKLHERVGVREQIEENLDTLNVIVTTYTLAKQKDDNKFLRRLKPVVCVYDEGHVLKNSKSAGYVELMRIPARFRLLLTGTPLQNNLSELASLLGFILPSVFREHRKDLEFIFSHKAKTTDESHAALLSTQRIARAKSMMTPFILRRKKHQVLKYLVKKSRRVEYCEMTRSQTEIYDSEKARALQVIEERAAGQKTTTDSANIMMALRKASIHPLVFRRIYNDKILSKMSKACIKEKELGDRDIDIVYEDMTVMTDFELHVFCEKYPSTMSEFALKNDEWMDSGKVKVLSELLVTYKENGDRALVFSQFVMMMDILEFVLETLGIRFFRLDGATKIDERQDMIDQFYDEEDITVFLLSTKAGGAGINLACANKVIIFDSGFNPQDDIQAENRAHRVGQKRDVEVIRLVTRGTIEEQIHALGETKLALDDRVAGSNSGSDSGSGTVTGEGDAGSVAVTEIEAGDADDKIAEKRGAKAVEEMMFKQIQNQQQQQPEPPQHQDGNGNENGNENEK